MDKFGLPSGYFNLDQHHTVLLYGEARMLLCYDEKLDGVLLNGSMPSYDFKQWLKPDSRYAVPSPWSLSNGISQGASRAELKKMKGVRLDREGQATLSSPDSYTSIGFLQVPPGSQDDTAYQAHRVLIVHRLPDGADRWRFIRDTREIVLPMLGFAVMPEEKGMRITEVFSTSPADLAGLKPGELVTHLDGAAFTGADRLRVMAKLSASGYAQIQLTVHREGDAERQVTIRRDDVAVTAP